MSPRSDTARIYGRMKNRKQESVNHLSSECSKLVQHEYNRRHDNVTLYMHLQLSGKAELERSDGTNTPEQVVENESFRVLWDFNVQSDRLVEARRPDIVLVDKQVMEAKINDIAIPGDARVKDKELEKIEKCQLLREEIRKLCKLKKVTVKPVVVGALGAVSDMFNKHMEKLGITIRLEVIPKTVLLGTARLLRTVLPLKGIRIGPPWDL